MGERVAGCDGSTGIRWKCPLLEEIGTTHTDMEASSRRKERRKESIEDLALLFTPAKTERRRRGRVPYRMIESG